MAEEKRRADFLDAALVLIAIFGGLTAVRHVANAWLVVEGWEDQGAALMRGLVTVGITVACACLATWRIARR